MTKPEAPIHVSLIALPEGLVAPLAGLCEALLSFDLIGTFDDAVPSQAPFEVEIVAPPTAGERGASGLPHGAGRTVEEVARTDLAIVPSVLVEDGRWVTGRYPETVEWLKAQHSMGGVLCSSCSGVLLLAETGLLEGREATVHWAYAPTFRRNFPGVKLRMEEVLITTGDREDFVLTGASASWHDLALYLVARYVGPTAAQAIAKFLLLQRHTDGQAPYLVFDPPLDHGDGVVLEVQEWIRNHYTSPDSVEEMERRSGLPSRSFKRRFARATGHPPLRYVQMLRVEEAKRRLERTTQPVERISQAVGYEDPSFFRRLFKRTTRLTPAEYRRKFRMPTMA